MKPSDTVKSYGFVSMAEVARLSGESEQNLINWSRNKPRKFELLLKGLVHEKMLSENEEFIELVSELDTVVAKVKQMLKSPNHQITKY